jgi:hypothetical protein
LEQPKEWLHTAFALGNETKMKLAALSYRLQRLGWSALIHLPTRISIISRRYDTHGMVAEAGNLFRNFGLGPLHLVSHEGLYLLFQLFDQAGEGVSVSRILHSFLDKGRLVDGRVKPFPHV